MGQEVRGVPEAPSLAATGVGHYLASQRRLRGISLDELAGLTKIPRRSLERLEAGTFDTAPDGFVRGFVRSVAESLGLDPDEAVMRLMDEPVEAGTGPIPETVNARWLLFAALGAVGLGLLAGLVVLLRALFAPAPPGSPEDVILRRDPVRSLASDAAPVVATEPVADAATPVVEEGPSHVAPAVEEARLPPSPVPQVDVEAPLAAPSPGAAPATPAPGPGPDPVPAAPAPSAP